MKVEKTTYRAEDFDFNSEISKVRGEIFSRREDYEGFPVFNVGGRNEYLINPGSLQPAVVVLDPSNGYASKLSLPFIIAAIDVYAADREFNFTSTPEARLWHKGETVGVRFVAGCGKIVLRGYTT